MRHHSGNWSRRELSRIPFITAFYVVITIPSFGDAPHVHFDHPHLVGCRDISSLDHYDVLSGERIVKATIRWSIRIHDGSDRDVEQVLLRFYDPARRMRVLDFTPKNSFESDYVGEIEVVETTSETTSRGISTGSGINFPHKDIAVQVSPSGEITKSSSKNVQQKGLKVAPRRLVIASGMIHNGYGVFLKLRRSEQDSFEGFKEISVVFAVPANWQVDRLMVVSDAMVREKSVFGDRVKHCCRKTTEMTLIDASNPDASRIVIQQKPISITPLEERTGGERSRRPFSNALTFLRNALKPD